MFIEIAGPNYHFCACHFIAAAHLTEPLHGHNFMVRLRGTFQKLEEGLGPDFDQVAAALQATLRPFQQKILLAQHNPYYQVLVQGHEVEVRFKAEARRYLFPTAEVKLLPLENVSTEGLAQLLHQQFLAQWPQDTFLKCAIHLAEAPGMAIIYEGADNDGKTK
jgi:6-pyruvoyl-tetrahydropterin synthase